MEHIRIKNRRCCRECSANFHEGIRNVYIQTFAGKIMEIFDREKTLKYVAYEFVNLTELYSDYRNLITKLAKSNMIPQPLGRFIKGDILFETDCSLSDFHCKMGYFFGSEMTLQIDAAVFPFRKLMFHRMHPVGNGSINPIYKLFRDFSDAKKYRIEYAEDISNPPMILKFKN